MAIQAVSEHNPVQAEASRPARVGHSTGLGELTERQQEVLDATLALLVENPNTTSMIAVARRASCSKETLYKWFGDRNGLLAATVRYQASKVKVGVYDPAMINREILTEILAGFATDLLTILTSDRSKALNRIAISQAQEKTDREQDSLSSIVLQNGRFSTGPRLKPVIEAGCAAGLIAVEDSEEAFRTFYGLVVRDVHIRTLLGEELNLSAKAISSDAERATAQFMKLFGADPTG